MLLQSPAFDALDIWYELISRSRNFNDQKEENHAQAFIKYYIPTSFINYLCSSVYALSC